MKRPDQHPQLPPDGALIRRMDAYLSGESTEATAIIKDARAALSSQAPADRPTDEQIEDACFAATGCRDRDVCAGFDEGVKWALQSRQPAAPAQPSGEAATVAIDNLHNDRRDGRTGYIWPPVKIGTRLYTAPQPAARVAMTPEQVRDGMADWIEASMPHKEFWTPDVVALIRSIEIKPELYRGITSNGEPS